MSANGVSPYGINGGSGARWLSTLPECQFRAGLVPAAVALRLRIVGDE